MVLNRTNAPEETTIYRMAVDWGDGWECHFKWLTTEEEALRYYIREREVMTGIPTALIGPGGSIVVSDD